MFERLIFKWLHICIGTDGQLNRTYLKVSPVEARLASGVTVVEVGEVVEAHQGELLQDKSLQIIRRLRHHHVEGTVTIKLTGSTQRLHQYC